MAVQTLLVLAAAYFQPFNAAFDTRDCVFTHLGIAAIPFCIIVLLLKEGASASSGIYPHLNTEGPTGSQGQQRGELLH
jgi:hypothetical protein